MAVRGLSKSFPGVRALDDVSLELRRSEVHALVGENGAGKSTLINLLGGILRPDAGEIHVDGRPVHLTRPREAADLGIAIVSQELSLAPHLSVAENVFCNRQPTAALGLIRRPQLAARTREALASFQLALDPWTPVKKLSVAQGQVIELLKALTQSPRVLILDEPTASLGATETARLFEVIRAFQAAGGSVVYVSHRLAEVIQIADRVTVLRDGRHVATRLTAEVTEGELARLMVGRPLTNIFGRRERPEARLGPEVLRLEGDNRLSIRQGEILGLAGLVGAGRTELARAVFGAEPLRNGHLFLRGRPVRIRSPRDAIAHGIAYVTEDRKGQGLFLKMPLRDNCVSPRLATFARGVGLVREGAVSDFAQACRERFRIITPDVRQQVCNLSGGNQQKVLLAMWLGIEPALLIVDEPTRGVDIGDRSEIYQLLNDAAGRGIAILLISSDLPELLGLCDRIAVMRAGRLVGFFSRAEATEEKIVACASGL